MSKRKISKVPRSLRRMFPELNSIIDAKHSITVNVKEIDCKNAEPLNAKECAMARAFKREFHADAAVIGISSSYIIKGKKAIRFLTPSSVQREIVSFDRHSDFATGSYILSPFPPKRKLGVSYTSGIKKNTKNHSSKRKIHKTVKIREFK